MTFNEFVEALRAKVANGADIGKVLKFDFGGDGVAVLDGGQVVTEDRPADLTVSSTLDAIGEVMSGRLNPMSAVMTGKIRVSDPGLAMSLQPKLAKLFS